MKGETRQIELLDSGAVLEQCLRAENFDDLKRHLQAAGLSEDWTTWQRTSIARRVVELIDDPDVKVAFLSGFTVDLLPQHCALQCATTGIACTTYLAPYNQYMQEILAPASGLHSFKPDITVLAFAMRDLSRRVAQDFAGLSSDQVAEELETIATHCEVAVNELLERSETSVLVCNFQIPTTLALGVADGGRTPSEMAFYYQLNLQLLERFQRNSRVFVLDIARLVANCGSQNVFDPKMYYLARLQWSERLFPMLAQEIARHVIAIQGRAKKCLVVDLDNTLWDGVIGEEGAAVRVGQGDPIAEAYFDAQLSIKKLRHRGVMLAICSKNNFDDVTEVFEQRPDMPLKLDDFVAIEANWELKHTNLERLAERLKIGLDSMVFLDDSPAECALIRQLLPQVTTVQVPLDRERMAQVIDDLVYFEKTSVLEEDLAKTEHYQQQTKREKIRESAASLEAYLFSLETEVVIESARDTHADRIHQLFSKTNQFNTTTQRYTPAKINQFLNDDPWDLAVFSASDVFGDLGIIGLYLVHKDEGHRHIDSFVMSCRAMGRGIEVAVMNHLKQQYFATDDDVWLTARFCATAKNKPAASFYDDQGFSCVEEAGDAKHYSLKKQESHLGPCRWITMITR